MLLRVKRRAEDAPIPALWHGGVSADGARVFGHVGRTYCSDDTLDDDATDAPAKRPRVFAELVRDVCPAGTSGTSGVAYDYYAVADTRGGVLPEGAAECILDADAVALLYDGEGETDSDAGSDSNAEGHFANEYPDESDADSMDDDACDFRYDHSDAHGHDRLDCYSSSSEGW